MTSNVRTLLAMAIVAFALAPTAATAQSYSGNWPDTVTHSQSGNGRYCITLHDDGSLGWPHSGEATLSPSEGTYPGTFQVISGLIMITFPQPGGTGELGALFFVAHASNGLLTSGTYEQFYGAEIDSGVSTFGVKNTCSGQ